MGEFAFKFFLHVSFVVVVVVVVVGFAYKMIQARRTSSFDYQFLQFDGSRCRSDVDGACSFIHCVVNRGLLSSWSDKNCIVMRARKRRHEGI